MKKTNSLFEKSATAVWPVVFWLLFASRSTAQCTVSKTTSANVFNVHTCSGQSFVPTCSASLLTVAYFSGQTPNWVQILAGDGTTGTVLYSNTSPLFSGTTHTLTSNVPLTSGNSYTVLFIRTGLASGCGHAFNGVDYPGGTMYIYSGTHQSGSWAAFGSDLRFTFTLGAFLPVEMTFFEAKSEAERVRLDWQTASETNNRGFEIERSNDGFFWQNIGFEDGKGTATARSDYSFLDQKPLAGQSFYRLRQMDFDGKSEVSNIVSIHRKSEKGVTVAPNPASADDQISIFFDQKSEAETLVVRLFDAAGRLVKTEILEAKKDATISTAGLEKGIFQLEIDADGERFLERVVVQ